MEHALNLAADHFTKAITLSSSSQVDEEEGEDVDTSDAFDKALALITQVF